MSCWIDFGDLPKAVQNLLDIVLLKAMAHRVYVEQVKQKQAKELGIYHV